MVFLLISSFVESDVLAECASVPKTGQTKCYNTTTDPEPEQKPCDGTGQDGELQMGVEWPNPRFTNPDGSTPVNGDVALDKLTGLMWTKNANLGQMSWQDALTHVADMNEDTYENYGYTDWRVPNVREMLSLLDFSDTTVYEPMLPSDHPFINWGDFNYWSSTTNINATNEAWYVYISQGPIRSDSKSTSYYFWPVRSDSSPPFPAPLPKTGNDVSDTSGEDGELQMGVEWPVPRFTDNEDGTVTDNLTGLVWLKNAIRFG